jgi:deazaflavin-dependent oxidoreductase (nitroreductase family)
MYDFKSDEYKQYNNNIVEEFRANQGKVGGRFEGAPMLLLTTTGSKTGRQFTTPLVHARDGERIIIFASKAGYPENPSWFNNLVATPTVTVEVGTDKFEARASVLEGEEREILFERQATANPIFAEYQSKTTRKIPVVALDRL